MSSRWMPPMSRMADPRWKAPVSTASALPTSGNSEGDTIRALDTKITWVWSSGAWAQGPTGPAGSAGTAGAPGAVGATGLTGATGAVGATGPTGSAGAAGVAGTAGAAGATGAAGVAGAAGPTGPMGPTGATGPAGVISAAAPLSLSSGVLSIVAGNVPTWLQLSLVVSGANFLVKDATGATLSTTAMAAATTQSLTILGLAGNTYVEALRLKTKTAFTGTTTLSATIGVTGATSFFSSTPYDLKSTVAAANLSPPLGTLSAAGNNTTAAIDLVLALTSTLQNMSSLTTGELTIWVLYGVLDAQ